MLTLGEHSHGGHQFSPAGDQIRLIGFSFEVDVHSGVSWFEATLWSLSWPAGELGGRVTLTSKHLL
jgi:hypothetical protein